MGLPDFDSGPTYAVKGPGRREQAARLLLSGGHGADLRSKRRTVRPKDDVGERSRLQRNAAKALTAGRCSTVPTAQPWLSGSRRSRRT